MLDAGEHSEPYTWADLAREPLAIAVDSSRLAAGGAVPVPQRLSAAGFLARREGHERTWLPSRALTAGEIAEVRFTFDLVNQGRVLGAVHDFGWGSLIAGQDVGDRLAEDYIASILKRARAEQRQERETDKARTGRRWYSKLGGSVRTTGNTRERQGAAAPGRPAAA